MPTSRGDAVPIEAPAVELLPLVDGGRCFVAERTVRLGDVDQNGELRLDAIARYLQDVAADDVADAGLARPFGWVVRRTLVDVRRAARLGEVVQLATFCSGTGRCWAERRTSISGAVGGSIEAVSLWIQVDPQNGRPAQLDADFHRAYGAAAGDRRISTRLALPRPAPTERGRPWTVRAADLDVLGHVNNAVHWTLVEDVLMGRGMRRFGVGEMEYLAPVDAGVEPTVHLDAADATALWLLLGETVLAAARWTPATTPA
jgi:acyl-ACP thioesterase